MTISASTATSTAGPRAVNGASTGPRPDPTGPGRAGSWSSGRPSGAGLAALAGRRLVGRARGPGRPGPPTPAWPLTIAVVVAVAVAAGRGRQRMTSGAWARGTGDAPWPGPGPGPGSGRPCGPGWWWPPWPGTWSASPGPLQRQEEFRATRIALAAGTTAQLVVDTPRFMALGSDDVEPARFGHGLGGLRPFCGFDLDCLFRLQHNLAEAFDIGLDLLDPGGPLGFIRNPCRLPAGRAFPGNRQA